MIFLNHWTKPVLYPELSRYFSNKKNFNKETFLLLCNADFNVDVGANWRGLVLSTKCTFDKFKTLDSIVPNLFSNHHTLSLDTPYNFKLHYGAIDITTIAVSGNDEDNVFFIVENEYVTRIIIYVIPKNLDVILTNNILRKIIRRGVDVLYINDECFKSIANSSPNSSIRINNDLHILYSLVYIIRPKFIYGILHNTEFPQYIYDCCNQSSTD